MKRIWIATFITLAAFAVAACGASKGELDYIGADTARTKALHAAGLEGIDVPGVSCSLEERDGKSYYRVDIDTEAADYSYDIDALSGAIIAMEEKKSETAPEAAEVADAAVMDDSGKENLKVAVAGVSSAAAEPSSKSAPEPAAAAAPAPAATAPEAVTSPTPAAAGAAPAPAATAPEAVSSPTPAAAGAASAAPAGKKSPSGGGEGCIGEEKAKQIALSRVPGATASNFVKFHLDYDDGRAEYEGEILYQGWEYDFEIDAYSGAVRDWDAEPWDD